MAIWIVDASVAVKWFVAEVDSDRAARLLDPSNDLIAPDLALAEIVAVLSRKVREGQMRADHANLIVAAVPNYFAEFVPFATLLNRGLELCLVAGHPLFDCMYLAIADARGLPLITADAKFAAKLAGTPFAKSVVLLSDWTPP